MGREAPNSHKRRRHPKSAPKNGANNANQWNPKYGCWGTVTTRFALIALVAWQYSFDSTLRKLSVHPKYGWNGTVSRVFPLIALIALGAFFHRTPGSLVAQCSATPATVAATPPCSTTPFQTQISVRHLRGQRGGRCDTKNFWGCSATPVLHLLNA